MRSAFFATKDQILSTLKKPEVVVIDADKTRCQEVCVLLQQLNYRATPLHSLADLENHLPGLHSGVIILDLDTVAANNYFFRDLQKRNLGIVVLGVSSLPYHPGLEEAMGSHIYACLVKPLDPEELRYWLRTISENLPDSPGTPEG